VVLKHIAQQALMCILINRNKTNYKSSLGMGIGIASDDRRQSTPNIAPVPPPSVKELVETHQSRFN
jgi:hypothetical protein